MENSTIERAPILLDVMFNVTTDSSILRAHLIYLESRYSSRYKGGLCSFLKSVTVHCQWRRVQVGSVTVVLERLLQASQPLENAPLQSIFPQRATLNQAVVLDDSVTRIAGGRVWGEWRGWTELPWARVTLEKGRNTQDELQLGQ